MTVRFQVENNNNRGSSNGGCLSTIFSIIVTGIAIFIGANYGFKTLIAGGIICLIVIPVIFGIFIETKNSEIKEIQEAWNLYNEEKYTLALEKAERIAKMQLQQILQVLKM